MTNISHCGQTLGATEEIGLRLDSLSTGYGHCKVGNSLNAEAKKGEITCLLGPNGCGKSTLIKTLMGILPPLGGRIGLNGEDFLQCPAPKRALVCSVVLTEQLFPDYLRVEELVWLGRFPHRSAC